ncbi:fibronectin type III domain-containing protein, partial [Candidatus Pacearchaeota archaeon]|nr:fibronectin type III domain-containing protein [Candidatus Pacearchaeota archaeon]
MSKGKFGDGKDEVLGIGSMGSLGSGKVNGERFEVGKIFGRFVLVMVVFVFMSSGGVSAAGNIIWCNPNNTGVENGFTKETGYNTLWEIMSVMSSGDTVIIVDGDWRGYPGMSIDSSGHLPSPGVGLLNMTTIRAETDWGVKIHALQDSGIGRDYVIIQGIIFEGSSILYNWNYAKIIRCGFIGPKLAGNIATFALSGGASYNLVEECIAWGGGRYKFLDYQGNHNIFRRCVARHDWYVCDDWKGQESNFRGYGSQNSVWQNCISIDSDREEYQCIGSSEDADFWVSTSSILHGNMVIKGLYMAYYLTGTGGTIIINNSIALGPYLSSPQPYLNGALVAHGGVTVNSSNMLIIDADEINQRPIHLAGSLLSLSNSIVRDANYYIGNPLLLYLYHYNILGIWDGVGIVNADPYLNGLLYPLRIEVGSPLAIAGSNRGVVGPTILKKIGVSGTLYGEQGWDETTNEDLWPWPNEDKIKELMSETVDGVSGIYGFIDYTSPFGSSDTLTSYIWEYLGNPCPPEICNYNITEIICVDSDGDGYNQSQSGCGTADCNDSNSSIYPGATEICGNGIDEDCDGSDLNCTEDTTSPILSDITATPSTTSATVNWITDEAATSIVEYGLTISYGNSEAVLSFVLSHLVSLTGLQENTLYHYRVLSNDSAGNEAMSGDNTFTTTVETGGDDGGDSGGSNDGGGGGSSSSTECVLTNAYWSTASAIEGQQVLLTVEGTDCDGEGIDLFVIWEDDLIGDDSVNVNPSTVDFSKGAAVSTWTVEYQDDFFGEPEY